MKHNYKLFTISVALFFLVLPLEVISQQVYQLNNLTDEPAQVFSKTVTGEDQARTYFSVNEELFETQMLSHGDILKLELIPGSFSEMQITRISEYVPGIYSYITRDASDSGSTMAFTYSNGVMKGMLHNSDHSSVFIEHDKQTGANYFSDTTYHGDELACGVHDELTAPPLPEPRMNKTHHSDVIQSPHTPSLQASQSLAEDEITIDLLIAYTPKASDWADISSDIETVIAQSMNLSQETLDNSNTGIVLRLVHYYETDYHADESESVTAGDHLRRFTQNPAAPLFDEEFDGYMEEVHDLRNQYGADFAALFASEPNTGGIAWLLNSIQGREDIAFSVNRVQQVGNGYTLVHEMGHNMGKAHARNQPTAAAGERGGLFEYSTGLRFESGGTGYATVMAYSGGGFSRIPYFSSTEVEFSGRTTGTETRGSGGPSDNVRSFHSIKRTVANYRNTLVDPPAIEIAPNEITVNLNREDQTDAVVNISNNGLSDLMWDVDFRFAEGTGGAAKAVQYEDPVYFNEHVEPSVSADDNHLRTMKAAERGTIYSTVFSEEEGFILGTRMAIESWGVFGAGDLTITDSNPSVGSNHLRMESLGSGNNIVVTPYFGPQMFSKYEVSMDVYIPDDAASMAADFIIYALDKSTPDLVGGAIRSSGGVFFQGGGILWVRDLGTTTDGGWFSAGTFNYGQYNNIRIVYNTDSETIDYYVNDELRRQSEYIESGGFKPDQLWIRHLNDADARWDIDNLVVKRTGTPTSWLSVNRFGGVTSPEESSDLTLTFNTAGMEAGTHELTLLIRGNDPEEPVLEIPVTLEVNEAVSVENQETPIRTQLAQNYPNPFNPSTMISYTLAGSGQVNLSVYDLIGRKVATLVNGQISAGEHQVRFDAGNLSSGVYIYRLQTPAETLTRQMVLIK